MNYKSLFFIAVLAAAVRCEAQNVVKFNDPHIRYEGRIAMSDSAARLAWSASDVLMNFKGKSIAVTLKDERSDNNYNVIIDGKIASILHPDTAKKTYLLASNLSWGKHTVELFKRTEWAMGKTWFYGFKLAGKGHALPLPPAKKHKIEFYGNSITCGYADEDSTGKDRGTSQFENGYMSYAAVLARHFNATLYNISKSGIGITVSWFPLIMPEMYDRLDATDPDSKWDFSKYTPDIVVINLFQNDSWIVKIPDNPQFKARFGKTAPSPDFITNAYKNFVSDVRAKYPQAKIICVLGPMDITKEGSPWSGYVEKAVAELHDKNIYTHFFPYKNTSGHPTDKEQQATAKNLEAFIHQQFGW